MKRASIIKFVNEEKYIIYPINTLKGGGGKASAPYTIDNNLTYQGLAEILLKALEHSIVDAPRPLDVNASHKHYLRSIGVKTMKALHDGSINVNVFTKDDNYYISPTVNKGARQGFQGASKDRIIIPVSSTLEELASALKEAFRRNS